MSFGRYAALADDDVWPAEISGRSRDVMKFSRGPLARSLAPAAFERCFNGPCWQLRTPCPRPVGFR
jgi:hypothetical protein